MLRGVGVDLTEQLELKVLDVIMCEFLGLFIQVIINVCSPFNYNSYLYIYLFIFFFFFAK